MNSAIFVAVVIFAQLSSGYDTVDTIDDMTTEQQKEWLLAHLTADLRFNADKIAVWEEKLDDMTPRQVAITAKAYVISQDKKRKQEERNDAIRLAKSQTTKQYYWNRYYYKYWSNYNYHPTYRSSYNHPNFGYPLRPIYIRR